MLLSEDEIRKVFDDVQSASATAPWFIRYAQALQAAMLAKLAGAELPEPVAWLAEYGGDVYASSQLHEAHAQGFAAGAAAQLAQEPVGCVVVHGNHKVGMLPAQRDIEAGEMLYTRREAK